MIDFDELMPDLEPELPMCPVPVIERRLREACIEACEDAAVWRFHVPEIQLIKGVRDYTLYVPEGTDVHSILAVSRSGTALDPTQSIEVRGRGSVSLFVAPVKDSVDPASAAKSNRGLCVLVTLKPGRRSRMLGDEMFRDHHKMLVHGTLAKAYQMTGHPWSSPDLAHAHRVIFEQEIASARRARERGYVTGSHRLKPVGFAAPTRRRGY